MRVFSIAIYLVDKNELISHWAKVENEEDIYRHIKFLYGSKNYKVDFVEMPQNEIPLNYLVAIGGSFQEKSIHGPFLTKEDAECWANKQGKQFDITKGRGYN